jgi:hypothetical protein
LDNLFQCSTDRDGFELVGSKVTSFKFDIKNKRYVVELDGKNIIFFNDYYAEVNCGYCGKQTKTNFPYPQETIWKTHEIYNQPIADENGRYIKIGTKHQCTDCNVKFRIENY